MSSSKPKREKIGPNRVVKTGLKMAFPIGNLPRGANWVARLVSKFRGELEALCLHAHGSVDARQALAIQTACRHEQAALLVQRWLRLHAETMTHAERLTYAEAIGKQSSLRDKSVDRLRLDVDTKSMLAGLYDQPTAIDALPADCLVPESKNSLAPGD